MNGITRFVATLVVLIATVLVALGIFKALSFDTVKDSVARLALVGLVIIVAAGVVTLLAKQRQ